MSLPELDWSNFNPPGGGNSGGDSEGRIIFLRFANDTEYRVRPLGNAVQYYKFFIERGKPSLIVHPQNRDAAAKLLSEHAGREIKAQYRCAMFVIDRADSKIKVMEGGTQIFDAFAKWSQGTGIQVGYGQGSDWGISVEGKDMGRKYKPLPLGATVFSDDERAEIKKMKAADHGMKLESFLPETPLEDLLEKAFGVKGGPAASSPPSAPSAPSAPSDSDGDDLKW